MLMGIECRRQTTILVLDSAFLHTHPELTIAYQLVAQKCPSLLRYLTTTTTNLEPTTEDDFDSHKLVSDPDHADVEA
jgi:hypothetical protein